MILFNMKKGANLVVARFAPFRAEREALELILSQNIIKLQTTDNQV